MKTRTSARKIRHHRLRSKIIGTSKVPRLVLSRSHKYLYAQIIDDSESKTIVGLSDKKIENGTKSEKATKLGEEIAKQALEKKVEKVVFDRSGNRYLGRVKLFAEGARKGGLKF